MTQFSLNKTILCNSLCNDICKEYPLPADGLNWKNFYLVSRFYSDNPIPPEATCVRLYCTLREIPLGALPPTITFLAIDTNDNMPILNLPPSLTHLYYGFYQRTRLPSTLPSLRRLTLGYYYNEPLPTLPETLTELKLGESFDQPVSEVILPPNLQCITLGYLFQIKYLIMAPASLETVCINLPPMMEASTKFKEIGHGLRHLKTLILPTIVDDDSSKFLAKLKNMMSVVPNFDTYVQLHTIKLRDIRAILRKLDEDTFLYIYMKQPIYRIGGDNRIESIIKPKRMFIIRKKSSIAQSIMSKLRSIGLS
ncbi:hypothetical protein SAMD00019534_083430 [Acytostelium subglobosum LB1]|uniref:hypothetical protein n=1 Tax=Acytostelium subglobosum LB1 TaxID=1410327 RepID=UPI0006450AAC|nr:hypothetical protein SAMD00019534_083430 [Acytostelium subglobosum LB1]GAM25168.1 hypothetical protein SAMD00019534_083430 [Acytostelium subglobosum LB1]|eukprot:XP_012751688.1 hypothetical protein SAMD00019534_083430 [Acytostelium subglobosum LB1]